MLAALLAILFVVTIIAINEVVTTVLEWNGTWANHQRHLRVSYLRDEFSTELDRTIREPFVQPMEIRNFSEAIGNSEAIEHARLQVIGAARAWYAGIEGAEVLLSNSVDALEGLMAEDAPVPEGAPMYMTATAPAS